MKELKIDPKLKALFKPLSKSELDELEEKLTTKYDGTPLYVWRGDIIVDGHNRYPLLKKHNIDFKIENVEDFLGEDCTRADIMQWMISHQQARRNLTPGELIFANSMVAEEIAEENKKKQLSTLKQNQNGENNRSVQMDKTVEKPKPHTSPTHTREQVAKLSGVGTGTVARYDAVMKSDDEELKKKVQTGEVKIGTAYKEIKSRETRVCTKCGKEKKLIEFFGNDKVCKDCTRKESEKNINAPKMQTYLKETENMKDIYEDVLTAKNAKEQINQDYEVSWLKDKCHDFVTQVNDKFFDLICVVEKMDREHINEAYNIFDTFVSDVFDIQEKLNNKL